MGVDMIRDGAAVSPDGYDNRSKVLQAMGDKIDQYLVKVRGLGDGLVMPGVTHYFLPRATVHMVYIRSLQAISRGLLANPPTCDGVVLSDKLDVLRLAIKVLSNKEVTYKELDGAETNLFNGEDVAKLQELVKNLVFNPLQPSLLAALSVEEYKLIENLVSENEILNTKLSGSLAKVVQDSYLYVNYELFAYLQAKTTVAAGAAAAAGGAGTATGGSVHGHNSVRYLNALAIFHHNPITAGSFIAFNVRKYGVDEVKRNLSHSFFAGLSVEDYKIIQNILAREGEGHVTAEKALFTDELAGEIARKTYEYSNFDLFTCLRNEFPDCDREVVYLECLQTMGQTRYSAADIAKFIYWVANKYGFDKLKEVMNIKFLDALFVGKDLGFINPDFYDGSELSEDLINNLFASWFLGDESFKYLSKIIDGNLATAFENIIRFCTHPRVTVVNRLQIIEMLFRKPKEQDQGFNIIISDGSGGADVEFGVGAADVGFGMGTDDDWDSASVGGASVENGRYRQDILMARILERRNYAFLNILANYRLYDKFSVDVCEAFRNVVESMLSECIKNSKSATPADGKATLFLLNLVPVLRFFAFMLAKFPENKLWVVFSSLSENEFFEEIEFSASALGIRDTVLDVFRLKNLILFDKSVMKYILEPEADLKTYTGMVGANKVSCEVFVPKLLELIEIALADTARYLSTVYARGFLRLDEGDSDAHMALSIERDQPLTGNVEPEMIKDTTREVVVLSREGVLTPSSASTSHSRALSSSSSAFLPIHSSGKKWKHKGADKETASYYDIDPYKPQVLDSSPVHLPSRSEGGEDKSQDKKRAIAVSKVTGEAATKPSVVGRKGRHKGRQHRRGGRVGTQTSGRGAQSSVFGTPVKGGAGGSGPL